MASPAKPWESTAAQNLYNKQESEQPPALPDHPPTDPAGGLTASSFNNNINNNNNNYNNLQYNTNLSRYQSSNGLYGGAGGSYIPNSTNYSSQSPYSYNPYGSSSMTYGSNNYGGYGNSYMSSGYSGGLYGNGGMNSYQQQWPYSQNGQNMQQQQQRGGPMMVLEQTVQILSQLTHLLDSTLMASHSSFMGVMGLIEQVGVLRSVAGGIVGVKWLSMLLGRSPSSSSRFITAEEFNGYRRAEPSSRRRRNWLFWVALAVLGVLGTRYINRRRLALEENKDVYPAAESQQSNLQQSSDKQQQSAAAPKDKATLDRAQTKIEFARALYAFTGRNEQEISFNRGDLIAVTSHPTQSEWYRGKLREGPIGYFPAVYVEMLPQNKTTLKTSYSAVKIAKDDASQRDSSADLRNEWLQQMKADTKQ